VVSELLPAATAYIVHEELVRATVLDFDEAWTDEHMGRVSESRGHG
jgi:hypothetical protein